MSLKPRDHSPLFYNLLLKCLLIVSADSLSSDSFIVSLLYEEFFCFHKSLGPSTHSGVRQACLPDSVSLRLFLKMNFLNRQEVFPSLLVLCLKL